MNIMAEMRQLSVGRQNCTWTADILAAYALQYTNVGYIE